MRLFVGIEFLGEILEELMKVQNQVRSQAKRGRFVVRENLHLTLQFLGEVPSQGVESIKQVLSKAAQRHSGFSMRLKHVGNFGNGQLSRVIWVGIDGDTHRLVSLQKDLSDSLTVLGFQQEKRPYKPHITLGRDVELLGEASFEKYTEAMAKKSFLVSRFSLIESKVQNGKLAYHSLYTFPLGSSNES